MAIIHYDGPLGKFNYDDTQFRISDRYFPVFPHNYSSDEDELLRTLEIERKYNTCEERLKYIGDETDGSKIQIPKGIKSIRGMFYGCDLETPPYLNDDIEDCTGAFHGCWALRYPSNIPAACIACSNMFKECNSLENAIPIPITVDVKFGVWTHCERQIVEKGMKLIQNPIMDDVDDIKEFCKKHYDERTMKRLLDDDNMLMMGAVIANEFEKSNNHPIYKHIIKLIEKNKDLTYDMLKSELRAGAKAEKKFNQKIKPNNLPRKNKQKSTQRNIETEAPPLDIIYGYAPVPPENEIY